jgi:hypothetical protein
MAVFYSVLQDELRNRWPVDFGAMRCVVLCVETRVEYVSSSLLLDEDGDVCCRVHLYSSRYKRDKVVVGKRRVRWSWGQGEG